MQYCYLQQTLLSPPDTFTTEHCFCFGPAASFFLKLLLIVIVLCSSLEAYWRPSDLGVWAFFFRSNIYIYFAFSYYSWGSPGLYWSGLPFPPPGEEHSSL